MLVAAAVCPHPPLLIPAVGGSDAPADRSDGARALAGIRAAAVTATRALADARPDLLVLLGDAPAALDVAGGTGSLAGLGVPVTVALGDDIGDGRGIRLPLSLTVGAWLLREAGVTLPVRALGLPRDMGAAEAAAGGSALAGAAPRVAILALGDASACRTEKAPGALDPRAAGYDEGVARALAAVDLPALLALDPALSDALLVAGRVAWQVLAGAAGTSEGWSGAVTAAAAPFGVGYLVASWVRSP